MKLLLLTIAVVDDLIAILIIAMFYSHGLSMAALVWAGVAIAGMWPLNRRGVQRLAPYSFVISAVYHLKTAWEFGYLR